MAKAVSEKKEAIKALKEEIADRKAIEVTIREKAKEEAIGDILKFGMNYKHSVLFMIKEKYHDLDFSNINFTDMRGYNVLDPVDGSESIGDLNIGESAQAVIDKDVGEEVREKGAGEIQVEHTEWAQVENVEGANFNPLSPKTESNVNPHMDEKNLVNVPSD